MRSRFGAAILGLMLIALALGISHREWHNFNPFRLGAAQEAARESIEELAQHIGALPHDKGAAHLSASLLPGGHWRLASATGDIITAVGKHELERALRTLTPEIGTRSYTVRVHLDAQSVLRHPETLTELPGHAELAVFIGGRSYRVIRADGTGKPARVIVGKALHLNLGEEGATREALRQLERPMVRSSVRMIALEPGGATRMPRAPVVESGARYAQPDVIDPMHLSEALGPLSGQIVLLSGRLQDDRLLYKPGSGPIGQMGLEALDATIQLADTNLIILDSSSARQPGTRNWLWQRVALSSAERALGGTTFGEFLYALAGEPDTLTIQTGALANGRIALTIEPTERAPVATVARLTHVVSETWSSLVSETAGGVSVRALRASMVAVARQDEVQRRLVPGVPFILQIGYLILFGLGLLSLPIINSWWQRLWPAELKFEYQSNVGFFWARLVRSGAFGLIFLPLAALPAIVAWALGVGNAGAR